MPKQYPLEFRQQVVLAIRNGLTIIEASQRYRIAQSTLYRWEKDTILTANISTADYTTLQRKSQRFDHILQIICLSTIIDEVPLQRRLMILVQLHEQFNQYSIHELCEALNVSRGTFCNHIFRRQIVQNILRSSKLLSYESSKGMGQRKSGSS